MPRTGFSTNIRAVRRRAARLRSVANGRCVDCKDLSVPGLLRCDKHMRLQREAQRRWRIEHPGYNRKVADANVRKRRRRAVKDGLCLTCLANSPLEGYKQCKVCLKKGRRQQTRRRVEWDLEGRRAKAEAAGLCTRCTKRPAAKDRIQCQHCIDVKRDRDARKREA